MRQKFGFAAGTAIVLGVAAIIGAYETSDEKSMPNWAFWAIIVTAVPVIVVAVLVWLGAWVVSPALGFARERHWVYPYPRKDAPSPNQELLDFAAKDVENPHSMVQVLRTRMLGKELEPDLNMPYIVFGVTVFNGNLFLVEFGDLHGQVTYKKEPLLSEPEYHNMHNIRIERGQIFELRLKQYIPTDLASTISSEIGEIPTMSGKQPARLVDVIDISGVLIDVKCDVGSYVKMAIGNAPLTVAG